MKFEIDEKTGMVKSVTSGIQLCDENFGNYMNPNVKSEDLETILQAVKKTQTKLINKDIQEIQDSKRKYGDSQYASREAPEPDSQQITKGKLRPELATCKDCGNNLFDIDQNQKIVNTLINYYTYASESDYSLKGLLSSIVKESTGKDIKDL